MSIEDTRARIATRVKQALEDSDVAWSTAQRQQLDALTAQITERVLVEFDALLDAVQPAGPAAYAAGPAVPPPGAAAMPGVPPVQAGQPVPGEEEVLWEGRPFLSISERYVVTTERVRIISGLIGKEHEDIELIRLQDVDHTQGVGERMLNIGDVFLRSTDRSRPDAVLSNVTSPEQVHEIIRRAMLNARRRYPFIFEQQM